VADWAKMGFSGGASAFAPWWLGLALAVSISADAGQDRAAGASVAPLSARAPLRPEDLVPATVAAAASGDFGRLTHEARRLLEAASLAVDDPAVAMRLTLEIEPRVVLGRLEGRPQVVDRHGRGDPVVGVRPTFDTGLRRPCALVRLHLDKALFGLDAGSRAGRFTQRDAEAASAEPSPGLEPRPARERAGAIDRRSRRGATSRLGRGAARDSAGRGRTSLAMPAGWIAMARDAGGEERRCLVEAVYFEARGESEEGQAAVAQVVLNRVSSGVYPPTVCGVVYQNRHRTNACQFSFACEGRSLRVSDPASWRTAARIAAEVANGKTYVGVVGGSTHYHADHVQPRWAPHLEKMDAIGHHIFYRSRVARD